MQKTAATLEDQSASENHTLAPTPHRRTWLWMLAGTFVLVAVAIALWQSVLKDRLIAKRWGVVEPGRIFRSGQLSPHLINPVLKQHGIQVVVDLTGDDPDNADQPAERRAIAKLGIELHKCPLWGDGTGDIRQYAAAIKALVEARRAGKPVLVHCYAGTQRTGGVVAMYRILVERAEPTVVLNEMRQYKWDPQRDRILLDYLNSHMAELAQLLVENGTLDSIPSPMPALKLSGM